MLSNFRNIAEKTRMRAAFYLLAVLLLASTAWAALFSYRDENGTLHAVRSEDDIPEKYRAGAKNYKTTESGSGDARVPLIKKNGSLLIKVRFGGEASYLMVLDTGASISMISNKVANDIGLKAGEMATIGTASGVVQRPMGVVPQMSVAQFTVKNLKVVVNDLPGTRGTDNDPQGLLGVDFLNHFKMELDTELPQLHLMQKIR